MTIVMKKKTKASKTTPAQRPSSAPAPAELPNGLGNRIAQKAYELWDSRGRRDGCALRIGWTPSRL